MTLLALLAACATPALAPGKGDDTDVGVDSDAPAETDLPTDLTDPPVDSAVDSAIDTAWRDPAPPPGCRAAARHPRAPRAVVVALPYEADGSPSDRWATLRLQPDGRLVDTGGRFRMGRAWEGEVVFTPDGSIGLAVQDDGSLGVLHVDRKGDVDVVQASYAGPFYASRVIMEPTGEAAWVVDPNWQVNGGGLYRVVIDCATGEVSGGTLALATKSAADLVPLPGGRSVVVGREAPGAAPGEDATLLTPGPTRLSGVDAFGDDRAIPSDAASIGEHVLIADNAEFSGVPTRVAAVRVDGDRLIAEQVLDLPDPVWLAPSPLGDVVLASSGYGNALVILDYAPASPQPLTARGAPAWVGARPQLPSAVVVITRGPLTGLALTSENGGVRRTWMRGGGVVEDLGLTPFGAGLENLAGAIGVQP